jgi:replicative DNA helicase
VSAVNLETLQLERCRVANAFSTGRKPIYALRTRLGHKIRATANHKFLTIDGWRRLDELTTGRCIALPRQLDGPTRASMTEPEVALLGHLIGDGCTLPRQTIQYTATARTIGAHVNELAPNTNRDIIPRDAWRSMVVPAMATAGVTTRELHSSLGSAYCGSSLYKSNLSRDRVARVAEIVDPAALSRLATSDVYWDRIASIEPDGAAEVFDLTVENHHNFVAEDIVVHNSIEQDADLVMFIYRDEYYDPESEDEGLAELLLSKHRNGGLGRVTLTFQKDYPRFMSYVGEDRYGP